MRKILVLPLALFMIMIPLTACNDAFTERDALSIVVVRSLPDGFILLDEIEHLISEADEYVRFYIWKNQAGIIDWSRRLGDERHKYAFDTHVQDTRFLVSLADGSLYVHLQTFLDFLDMLEIEIYLDDLVLSD